MVHRQPPGLPRVASEVPLLPARQFQGAVPDDDVAVEISLRLSRLFLQDADGRRPVFGGAAMFQIDPHWRDLLLFYECFHGENDAGIGASHRTGWTGLVATLLQQSGE